jgi:hypothetical protein
VEHKKETVLPFLSSTNQSEKFILKSAKPKPKKNKKKKKKKKKKKTQSQSQEKK